ncbi:fluoride efflux transporter CrcB [Phenylobacterium sp.]|uniref:fluoride efflux transporter CrcB n=1 Tax=Phenylobacterium sp. TaxID=1871053 RepID=UPI002DE88800|nr:fluoride efflux transporter CrcB [Phenylobacterium sp.]
MLTYLWIALGSALGGMARFALSTFVAQAGGGVFPWGILLVNVTGSFAIGVLATAPAGLSPDARLLLTVGLCGGYTTFSSFSLQTLDLLRQGHVAAALGNIAGSVVLCLLAVWAGVAVAGLLNGVRGAA